MRNIISYILIKGNKPAFKRCKLQTKIVIASIFSHQGKSLGTCHHHLSICIVFLLVLPV